MNTGQGKKFKKLNKLRFRSIFQQPDVLASSQTVRRKDSLRMHLFVSEWLWKVGDNKKAAEKIAELVAINISSAYDENDQELLHQLFKIDGVAVVNDGPNVDIQIDIWKTAYFLISVYIWILLSKERKGKYVLKKRIRKLRHYYSKRDYENISYELLGLVVSHNFSKINDKVGAE